MDLPEPIRRYLAFRKNLSTRGEQSNSATGTSKAVPQADPTLLGVAFAHFQQAFEALLSDEPPFGISEMGITSADLLDYKTRHTSAAYLCRWNTCVWASIGFRTSLDRTRHETCHQPRFRCPDPACDFAGRGFKSAHALRTHNEKYHTSLDDIVLPHFLISSKAASERAHQESQTVLHQQHADHDSILVNLRNAPSLIRTDQVWKLPHLSDAQKVTHTQIVRNFWEVLNSQPPNTSEYVNAHTMLTQLSQNLMKDMKIFQRNRSQQQQSTMMGRPDPQNGFNQTNQPQSHAGDRQQLFQQLPPQIQQKVNSLAFTLPPIPSEEQRTEWLLEAKIRYGRALEKQETGKVRLTDLRQKYAQRQSTGNLTEEELQKFRNRQLAAEKLVREGRHFLTEFEEQQERFRAEQQNLQLTNRQVSQSVPDSELSQKQSETKSKSSPDVHSWPSEKVSVLEGTSSF